MFSQNYVAGLRNCVDCNRKPRHVWSGHALRCGSDRLDAAEGTAVSPLGGRTAGDDLISPALVDRHEREHGAGVVLPVVEVVRIRVDLLVHLTAGSDFHALARDRGCTMDRMLGHGTSDLSATVHRLFVTGETEHFRVRVVSTAVEAVDFEIIDAEVGLQTLIVRAAATVSMARSGGRLGRFGTEDHDVDGERSAGLEDLLGHAHTSLGGPDRELVDLAVTLAPAIAPELTDTKIYVI